MPITSDINGNVSLDRYTPISPFSSNIDTNGTSWDENRLREARAKAMSMDMGEYIHFSKLYVVNNNGYTTQVNLFAHPFYYLQNSIQDIEVRECCKALLFLHTLPFTYENMKSANTNIFSFFNNKESKYSELGGIETVPYGYLLFLGGLIWRKDYTLDHGNTDPIRYAVSVISGSTSYVGYKAPSILNPLFVKVGGQYYLGCGENTVPLNFYNGLQYTDIVTTARKRLVEKKLVGLFKSFVKTGFQIIRKHCELFTYKVDGNPSYNVYPDSENNNDATNVASESDVSTKENRSVEEMKYHIIQHVITALNSSGYKNNINNSLSILNGEKSLRTPGGTFRVVNFKGNYVMGFTDSTNQFHTYYSENNSIQNIFKGLMYSEVIASTIPTPKNANGIQANLYTSYLNGYSSVISQHLQVKKKQKPVDNTETKKYERDLKCELYMNLKNIWDRWLCGYYHRQPETKDLVAGRDIFKVENFFEKNFVFINSFYTNIYDMLKLNCTLLLDIYKGNESSNAKLGQTVVAHLGNVASKHRCMMFNFPDAVNFSEVDRGGLAMEDYMTNMFKPVPSNKVDMPDYANKFTIIYTHSANKLDTIDRNKFTPDSFDIWSYEDGTGVAPTIFNSPCAGPGKNDKEKFATENRIGYKVPAFGVAYSRQDNTFWKNISVGMDNYSVTEQAIRAEAAIAEKGNSNKKSICFYGQDIYSLYQAYSYLVTVEMMGNAQIQPLMYFQLMNIPMFRGSYMIIKVEHSITPGHMITRFTGMKMSKVQIPFTTSWFTVPDEGDYEEPDYDMDVSDNGEEITSMEGDKIDIEDNKLSKAINELINSEMACDDFAIKVYKDLGVVINGNLRI